jgi:preprotein translocase subunit Sec61beta
MKKKKPWNVTLVCIIIAMILIATSIFLPWYYQSHERIHQSGGPIIRSNYQPRGLNGVFEFGDDSTSFIESYSEHEDNLPKVVLVFRIILSILLIVLFALFLLLITLLLHKYKKVERKKMGKTLVIGALVLTLSAPIFLAIAIPQAFESDVEDYEYYEGEEKSPLNSFFGEITYENEDEKKYTDKWGPSYGWFTAFFAFIFIFIAFTNLKKIYKNNTNNL